MFLTFRFSGSVQGPYPPPNRGPPWDQTESPHQLHVSSAAPARRGWEYINRFSFLLWLLFHWIKPWDGRVLSWLQITNLTVTALIPPSGRSRDSRGWLWHLSSRIKKRRRTTQEKWRYTVHDALTYTQPHKNFNLVLHFLCFFCYTKVEFKSNLW